MEDQNMWLIIPDPEHIEGSAELAKKYGAAFEYNDFYFPSIYSEKARLDERIEKYSSLPRDRSRDTMHGAFLDIAIASLDKTIREHSRALISQSFDIADRLGLRGVVFHTGLIPSLNYGGYQAAWLNAAEETFRPLCEKHPGITAYIENTFEYDPNVFSLLMERMSDVPNFKLCLDYAHASLSPTPTEVWIKELAPHIGHIHINDNDLVRDLHQAPGEGKIDFKHFKELCGKYGVNCPILLELNGIEKQKKALEFMSILYR